MLADMIGSMLLIFVVLAFYRLFKDVDKELAVWRRADGRARADLPGGVRQAAAGCAGNVVRGVARAPDHGRRDSVGRLYFQPAFFGELAIMLWLLIKGANPLRAEVSSA